MGSLGSREDGLALDGVPADALADYEHPVSVEKVRYYAAVPMAAPQQAASHGSSSSNSSIFCSSSTSAWPSCMSVPCCSYCRIPKLILPCI